MLKAWGVQHGFMFNAWVGKLSGQEHEHLDEQILLSSLHIHPKEAVWPFGNKYHTVCCCATGIMWGVDLVERKVRPHQTGQQTYDDLGMTVGLLLWLLAPIFFKGFVVILDSGFCVLKGIIELCKKGVFASALIKKRRY